MRQLILVAYILGAVAHLQVGSPLTGLDMLLQARHLGHQFGSSDYLDQHQLLRRTGRSGGTTAGGGEEAGGGDVVSQQQAGPSRSQPAGRRGRGRGRKRGGPPNAEKEQPKEPERVQRPKLHPPPEGPVAKAEISLKGPGETRRTSGRRRFPVMRVEEGRMGGGIGAGLTASAWGKSSAPDTAETAARSPNRHPVHGKASGAVAKVQVETPAHGRGHLVAENHLGRDSITIEGGENREMIATGSGPGTAKVEGSVSDGGGVVVKSYQEQRFQRPSSLPPPESDQ